jgi:hypothetical protein
MLIPERIFFRPFKFQVLDLSGQVLQITRQLLRLA